MSTRVDQILGKGQIAVDKKPRDKLHHDGDSLEGMSMLGRVCKVERQVCFYKENTKYIFFFKQFDLLSNLKTQKKSTKNVVDYIHTAQKRLKVNSNRLFRHFDPDRITLSVRRGN